MAQLKLTVTTLTEILTGIKFTTKLVKKSHTKFNFY